MRVDHIALWVSDVESAKAFYARLGGQLAPKGYHNPRSGLSTWFISFGDDTCRIELMHQPDRSRQSAKMPLGWAHMAISLGSREKVDRLVADLISQGIQCVSGPRVTGDGYYEAVIADPEGNLVELIA